jgi:hypothetical protein
MYVCMCVCVCVCVRACDNSDIAISSRRACVCVCMRLCVRAHVFERGYVRATCVVAEGQPGYRHLSPASESACAHVYTRHICFLSLSLSLSHTQIRAHRHTDTQTHAYTRSHLILSLLGPFPHIRTDLPLMFSSSKRCLSFVFPSPHKI